MRSRACNALISSDIRSPPRESGATPASLTGQSEKNSHDCLYLRTYNRRATTRLRGGPMDLGWRGKKVILTGATRGSGRACAELFASEGAEIGLCARSADEGETAVRELSRHGGRVVGEAVNVRDGEAYK